MRTSTTTDGLVAAEGVAGARGARAGPMAGDGRGQTGGFVRDSLDFRSHFGSSLSVSGGPLRVLRQRPATDFDGIDLRTVGAMLRRFRGQAQRKW